MEAGFLPLPLNWFSQCNQFFNNKHEKNPMALEAVAKGNR